MAKLAKKIKSFDELPENIRELAKDYYTQTDDGFILQLDGDDSTKKVNEFRENNNKLTKRAQELEEKLNQYGDLSPESLAELRDLKAKIDADEDMTLIKQGKVDQVFEKRTKAMKEAHTRSLNDLQASLNTTKQTAEQHANRLKNLLINETVTKAITSVGVPRPNAMEDILRRARERFDLDENMENVVPKGDDNDAEGRAWTPESWAQDLMTKADFLFEPSTGGGAKGSKKSANTGGYTWIDNDPIQMGKHEEGLRKGTVKVRGLD